MASCSNVIKIWDIKTDNLILKLNKHTSYVYSLAFSPDGSRLASGSYDNTIKIWKLGDDNKIETR